MGQMVFSGIRAIFERSRSIFRPNILQLFVVLSTSSRTYSACTLCKKIFCKKYVFIFLKSIFPDNSQDVMSERTRLRVWIAAFFVSQRPSSCNPFLNDVFFMFQKIKEKEKIKQNEDLVIARRFQGCIWHFYTSTTVSISHLLRLISCQKINLSRHGNIPKHGQTVEFQSYKNAFFFYNPITQSIVVMIACEFTTCRWSVKLKLSGIIVLVYSKTGKFQLPTPSRDLGVKADWGLKNGLLNNA